MSFPGPGRGRGSDSANGGVVMSAGRGAVLVAVAIVVGLLVLSVVNDRGTGSSTPAVTDPTVPTPTVPQTNLDGTVITTPATTAAAGTTATTKAKKSTSTTASVKGARPNDQVVVQVLNGSGIEAAATTRSNDLKAQGYQTVPAGNAPSQRTGTGVQCKEGYEKEAQVLATTLQGLGVPSTAEAISDPPPTQFDASANCYVLLGK